MSIFTERDAARLTNEAMFDRMDRKRELERYATMPTEPCGSPKDAICRPIGVQLPPLTVEAATARLLALDAEFEDWLCGCDVPGPNASSHERARLLAFIDHNP